MGNTPPGFTGPVTVAIGSNPGGGTLSGVVTAAAVNGEATFNSLSIDKTGATYTLTAAAAGLPGVNSAAFAIVAGPATQPGLPVAPRHPNGPYNYPPPGGGGGPDAPRH